MTARFEPPIASDDGSTPVYEHATTTFVPKPAANVPSSSTATPVNPPAVPTSAATHIKVNADGEVTSLYRWNTSTEVWDEQPFYHAFRDTGATLNFFLGPGAGVNNVSSTSANLGIGIDALAANTTFSGNTAVGANAMKSATAAGDCTALGSYALEGLTSGVGCTAIGFRSQRLNVNAGNNTSVGDSALYQVTGAGTGNTAMGYVACENLTTGARNTAVGLGAMFANVTGSDNVAIGASVLGGGTSSFSRCVAIGTEALYDNRGNDNMAIGNAAMRLNTTGFYNVAIGADAGNVNTTGIGNVYIGQGAGSSGTKVDAFNAIGIGRLVTPTKDNQVVLGNSSIVETILRGLICIGDNTVSYPALKRSGTTIQARTGTDSAFARFQGELQTSVNAVSASGLTPTHTIVIYDAAGQAYRVPCLV